MKDLQELKKNIKKNIKINEAKQNLQKRRGYVRELAKGKGDAYLKQLVKNLLRVCSQPEINRMPFELACSAKHTVNH